MSRGKPKSVQSIQASGRFSGSIACASALIAATCVFAAPDASAYTLTGCKFASGTQDVDAGPGVTGNYLNALTNARSDYTANTDVTLTSVAGTGNINSYVGNAGNTGWEAQAITHCVAGTTYWATVEINSYHLPSSSGLTRLKVVWEHELGHALGLNHVSSVARVMYSSASTAYANGVTGLTADDKNGINFLY